MVANQVGVVDMIKHENQIKGLQLSQKVNKPIQAFSKWLSTILSYLL